MPSPLSELELAHIPPRGAALRPLVRSFLDAELIERTPLQRAHSWTAFDGAFSTALAAKGWVGLTLPREYGGGGGSAFERFVLVEELLAAGAPVAAHWIAERQSGPLILRFGTDEQRRFYLPRICRGEAYFCIGMSEAGSGSDLASVRTKAIRRPGGWILNGSKLWTTHGHRAHYMIALARTSGGSDDRQKGLSQFIVDLALPGVTRKPLRDVTGDDHFSEVHFADVELKDEDLVGSEGAGWAQVNAELAFERSGPERIYSSMALITAWVDYLRTRGSWTDSEVQLVGRLLGEFAALRTLSLAVTGRLAKGESPVVEASMVKDLGTTFEQSAPRMIAEHLASAIDEPVPPELLRLLEYVAAVAPSFSIRGGTRDDAAQDLARGLGLR